MQSPTMLHPVQIPVEVVARILSFMLASPSDDPQKLPLARPHPISVLLVSKEITRLVLPHFYRSINISEPRDWYTLLNPKYGLLALDESPIPPDERRFPALEVRQGWVHELFLGLTNTNAPVLLPMDVFRAIHTPVDWNLRIDGHVADLVRANLPAWLHSVRQLRRHHLDGVVLPNLSTLVVVPRPYRFSHPPPQIDALLRHYHTEYAAARERAGDKDYKGSTTTPVEERRIPSKMVNISEIVQADMFAELRFISSGIKTVHFPADGSFMNIGPLSPFKTTYEVAAPRVERFVAYLDLKQCTNRPMEKWSPLGRFRALLGEVEEEEGSHRDDKKKKTGKKLVIVASASKMRCIVDREAEEALGEERRWEWLAPDGRRRSPFNALRIAV